MRPASSRAAEPACLPAASVPGSQAAPVVPNQLLFLGLAIAGCGLDLATKHWVFQWRGLPRPNNEWWIWEGYVGVETALNRGALFGMGQGRSGMFAAVSMIALAGIIYWVFLGLAGRDRWLSAALGCVAGGVLGNLYDRLGLWATTQVDPAWRTAVRDWILLRYGSYTWPNFNFADSLLVCGAIALAWQAFTQSNQAEPVKP